MTFGLRATVAVVLASTAVITLAGCSSGSGDTKADGDKPSVAATSPRTASAGASGDDTPSPTPTQVLAQIKGEKGIEVTINSATRDAGGFVTVEGVVTNNGTDAFSADNWVGNETALVRSGASVAGAVLVDEAGKKRYYVLRDTDGVCLCTMKLLVILPKESRPFFAQFPAPPAATTQVQFELPTMPPAKLTLSEG